MPTKNYNMPTKNALRKSIAQCVAKIIHTLIEDGCPNAVVLPNNPPVDDGAVEPNPPVPNNPVAGVVVVAPNKLYKIRTI